MCLVHEGDSRCLRVCMCVWAAEKDCSEWREAASLRAQSTQCMQIRCDPSDAVQQSHTGAQEDKQCHKCDAHWGRLLAHSTQSNEPTSHALLPSPTSA